MHLNEVAEGLEPLDLTNSDELVSLLTSARELGIAHAAPSRYVSRNTVVRHERLHFLEWGDPAAPPNAASLEFSWKLTPHADLNSPGSTSLFA